VVVKEEEEGLVEWDWIGKDSPMMARQSEPEFVLDRLCESLARYMRRGRAGRDGCEGRGRGGVGGEEIDERSKAEGKGEEGEVWSRG